MPRGKPDTPLAVRVPSADADQLQALAEERGTTVSEVARGIISSGLRGAVLSFSPLTATVVSETPDVKLTVVEYRDDARPDRSTAGPRVVVRTHEGEPD